MKTRIFTLVFILLAAANFVKAQPRVDVNVNFGFFYNSLAPQGEWLQIDDGMYGWRPNGVNRDWRPYSLGRWTWTEDGWYWDSYEPFGWATYHYGRWTFDDYYGWLWIPDYEWAPSWVEWRYDDDYIGWSPLPPYAGFRFGFGIDFSFGWHSPYTHWNFVRFDHFCHNRVHDYFIDRDRVHGFFEKTRYRTNYFDRNNRIINGGVDRNFVERRIGSKIRVTSFRTTSDMRDMGRNSDNRDSFVRIYRPSDNDVNRTRDFEVRNVKRPDRNITIEKSKVVIGNQRNNDRAIQRAAENSNSRAVTRSNNPAATNRDRNVTRTERQNNDGAAERVQRDAQKKAERLVRDNSARPERSVQRSQVNRNRGDQNVVKQPERNIQRQDKAAEKRAASENKSSERKVERGNSRDNSDRRR